MFLARRSGTTGVATGRVRMRNASLQVPRQGRNRAAKRNCLLLFFSGWLKRAAQAGAIVIKPQLDKNLALVWKQGVG